MKNSKKCVSVVIPSYNRAHILEKTIPSYIQDNVGEIIVVNDASTDNTEEVLKELKKKIPILKFITLKKNSKQTYAKNQGILLAKYPYIYFGDDDSFIIPRTIEYLLETLVNNNVEVAAARALKMGSKEDLYDIEKYILNCERKISKAEEIFDMYKFDYISFDWNADELIEVPFCAACALVKTEIAKKILFDTKYKGNGYREETDFYTRITANGGRILYDSRAIQINYPRDILGLKSKQDRRNTLKAKIRIYYYNIINTFKYFDSNYKFLKKRYNLKESLLVFKIKYLILIYNKILERMIKRLKNAK